MYIMLLVCKFVFSILLWAFLCVCICWHSSPGFVCDGNVESVSSFFLEAPSFSQEGDSPV